VSGLIYRHVDVFAHQPFSGNGLAVFPNAEGLSAKLMLRLTQELRQLRREALNRVWKSALHRGYHVHHHMTNRSPDSGRCVANLFEHPVAKYARLGR